MQIGAQGIPAENVACTAGHESGEYAASSGTMCYVAVKSVQLSRMHFAGTHNRDGRSRPRPSSSVSRQVNKQFLCPDVPKS